VGDRDAVEAVWRQLGSPAANSDPAAVLAAVPGGIEAGLLQAAVPVVIAAKREGAAADVDLARLVDALRARAWDGDDIAIEALLAAQSGTPTGRIEIPADLAMLGDVLGQQLGGYLERSTGEAWAASIFDDGDMDDTHPDEDPNRWLYVPGDTHAAWQDMVTFADQDVDPHVRELLELAVQGRGAFSRFKSVLDRYSTYWIDWRVWSSERSTGRARDWLAAQGYDPTP
jgi:hypothetical protein